ncbi:hypothetical protein BD770DRAFT_369003, partial [Pilaira anomala]
VGGREVFFFFFFFFGIFVHFLYLFLRTTHVHLLSLKSHEYLDIQIHFVTSDNHLSVL